MPKGEPDPDCGGKGVIELFTSSSRCDCVDRESITTTGCPIKYSYDIDKSPFREFEIMPPIKNTPPIFVTPEMVEEMSKWK